MQDDLKPKKPDDMSMALSLQLDLAMAIDLGRHVTTITFHLDGGGATGKPSVDLLHSHLLVVILSFFVPSCVIVVPAAVDR